MDKDGYGQWTVKQKKVKPHRFSYERTFGAIPTDHVIRHRCDNRRCCNPWHLLTGTPLDNCTDASERGRLRTGKAHRMHTHPETVQRGEDCSYAKVDEAQVLEILALWPASGLSQKEVGARYGLGQMQVSRICRGLRWKHLYAAIGAPKPGATVVVGKAAGIAPPGPMAGEPGIPGAAPGGGAA